MMEQLREIPQASSLRTDPAGICPRVGATEQIEQQGVIEWGPSAPSQCQGKPLVLCIFSYDSS